MKKLLLIFLMCLGIVFTGCEWSEELSLQLATTAGSVVTTVWVAVDNPTEEEKQVMKQVIELVQGITVEDKYLNDVTIETINAFLEGKGLDETKRQFVLAGAVLILGGLDEFFEKNPKYKETREIERKYVQAFCNGVALQLNTARGMDNAKKIYEKRCSIKNVKK